MSQDPRDAAASLVKLLLAFIPRDAGLPRDLLIHSMQICGQAAPGTVLGELCRHWAAAATGGPDGPDAIAAFVAFLLRPLPPVDAP